MRPLSHDDGYGAPSLAHEIVPSEAAVVDDVVVGLEDAVREPAIAQELPEVLVRVVLGTSPRQRQKGDVGGGERHLERVLYSLGKIGKSPAPHPVHRRDGPVSKASAR